MKIGKLWCFFFMVNACLSQAVFALHETTYENIFIDFYANRSWGESASLSGDGSDLTQTATIREEIPILLRRYNCDTMVDAPCGDFFWMRMVDLPVSKYTGVELVQEVIDFIQSKFSNEKYQFMQLDLTKGVIPKADMVLCRDCLVHLSYADIARAIRGFKASGSKYLLTTSFINRDYNYEIKTGEWHPLNLIKPPFNFPIPIAIIVENCTEDRGRYRDKTLCLWRIADLPDLNF